MPGMLFSCWHLPRKMFNNKDDSRRVTLVNFMKNFRRSRDLDRLSINGRIKGFEEDDRNDVCCMLPSLKDKKILDIGFNVGRHTFDLAFRGKCTYVTDLLTRRFCELEELRRVAKKLKRNVKTYVSTVDLVDFKEEKFFLVFTHWLFMYLFDEEICSFLTRSLHWLEKGGFLKFRESCGESSPYARDDVLDSSFQSMSSSRNFKTYRYISVYLKLIEEIRIEDKEGHKWKYNVNICSVMPTCIEKSYNWKELQLVAMKVPASDDDYIPKTTDLLEEMNGSWVINQEATDIYVGTTRSFFADKLFLSELEECPMTFVGNQNILTATIIYQPKCNPYYMRICPFNLPSTENSFIWTNEENREIFKSYISIADRKKISSMFFSYSKDNISYIFGYAINRKVLINSFLAINYLTDNNLDFLNDFLAVANDGAKIILLESYINDFDKENKLQKIFCPFSVESVTQEIYESLQGGDYSEGMIKCIISKKWMLIKVEVDILEKFYNPY
uniref:phosphoethanolamine N-methyltransferase n=1 Tax=Strongyloides papillosus TaxID=174720 RepID=A0A0N5B390_STREA